MNDPDVRWIQRLANYRRALSQLSAAVQGTEIAIFLSASASFAAMLSRL